MKFEATTVVILEVVEHILLQLTWVEVHGHNLS